LRVKATISYNGAKFYGLQLQKDKPTIASALYKAFKAYNINSSIDFSGRTDKGVHAFRQVISFELDSSIWQDRLDVLKSILNKTLSSSIKILSMQEAKECFHARYSAKKRVYRYLLTTKETSVFNDDFITYTKNQVLAVENTLANINLAFEPLQDGVLELFSHHINEALDSISTITRTFDNDEMLDKMFSSFCLGK
jgi:tRNA pseudouridine(38-40) synthase